MTRVLVLNCGSSSLRYRLYDGGDRPGVEGGVGVARAAGLVERIGEEGGGPPDHRAALRDVLAGLDLGDLTVVGHRVVHGGLRFTEPALVDDEVLAGIVGCVPLAPLHNPANLAGITVARDLLPGVPQVAVFDTAFHRTLPEAAATYAIDRQVAERHGIRRYGFHGTSHAYVSRRTAELLRQPYHRLNVVTLHLGNGASACAVSGGRSVATSMGLSPLEGLVMGTRSGDIDPAVVFHLSRAGVPLEEIDQLLNHRGGLLGLCGANDMREVLARRSAGDESAGLAVDVYCRRIREYVGAYYAVLGQLDAISFTAGVGENAAPIRAEALAGLDRLGISVDPERNAASGDRVISPAGAAVAVCVVTTDEEREIARQALTLLATARH